MKTNWFYCFFFQAFLSLSGTKAVSAICEADCSNPSWKGTYTFKKENNCCCNKSNPCSCLPGCAGSPKNICLSATQPLPKAVTGLTASVSGTSVNLKWSDPNPPVTISTAKRQYKVAYYPLEGDVNVDNCNVAKTLPNCFGGGSYMIKKDGTYVKGTSITGLMDAGSTSVTVSGLAAGKAYVFSVCPYNSDNQATTMTSAGRPSVLAVIKAAPPAAVIGLKVKPESKKFTLTWTAVPGATHYVYFSKLEASEAAARATASLKVCPTSGGVSVSSATASIATTKDKFHSILVCAGNTNASPVLGAAVGVYGKGN